MANAEAYAQWIVANPDKRGTPEFDTVAQAYRAARESIPEPVKQPRTLASEAMGSIPAQMAMGALRGAGSIGATLKRPFDLAEEYLAKQAGSTWRAPDRRTSMDEALQGMGADTSGLSFGAGKLGAEIAGTAGVGGLLAKAAPAAWGQALTTGGMTGGNLFGRSLAAGTVGGASAGLTGDSVGTGAAIGAAMPGAFKAAGAAGSWAGEKAFNALTPAVQKRALELAQATGRNIDEIVSALTQQGPGQIPGVQKTVPQILQDKTVSQVGRTLHNKGQMALSDIETQNMLARRAALERVAPTYGTLADARQAVGSGIEDFARPAEARARQAVGEKFDVLRGYPQSDISIQLPLSEMTAARDKFLGLGSFGKGLSSVDEALRTAQNVGLRDATTMVPVTRTETIRNAPIREGGKVKAQNLEQAVRGLGGIRPGSSGLGGEITDLGIKQSGTTGLINRNGLTAEDMAMRLHERGYLPEANPDTLVEMLRNRGGKNVYGNALTERDMEAMFLRQDAPLRRSAVEVTEMVPKTTKTQGPVSFDVIQNLRSSIGEAANQAEAKGQTQAAAALGKMKTEIDAKINRVASGDAGMNEQFSQQAVRQYQDALAEHAAKKGQFNTGPQAALFRKDATGEFARQGGQVPGLFWGAGGGQVNNMQAFKRLTESDQKLIGEMKRLATTEAGDVSSIGSQGAMSFDKFNKWMKTHSGAARELFTDSELSTLKAINESLRTANAAENLGRATGSNTAQNFFSQGLLDRPGVNLLANKVPFGNALVNALKGAGERSNNELLSRLLANPEYMAETLQAYQQRQAPSRFIELLRQPAAEQLMYRTLPIAQ